MKLIEAMKSIKDLQRKAEDIRGKLSQYCADLDCETPTYPDQKRQIAEWEQSHSDIMKEILSLRYRVQKTNVLTVVEIKLGDKYVKKSIAEWINRRKDLAGFEEKAWAALTHRGLKETATFKLTDNTPEGLVKRRLYFDPKERDEKVELYRSEPAKIDATLEVINAVTDLID